MEKLLENLNGLRRRLEAQEETIENEYSSNIAENKETMRKIDMLIRYSEKPPANNEDLSSLFSVVCYGGISYCCGPINLPNGGKSCLWRDSVLEILNISNQEFIHRKQEFDERVRQEILEKMRK